ncbi:zinc finger, CCHC-type containing protein [Tanacetum coccineum]
MFLPHPLDHLFNCMDRNAYAIINVNTKLTHPVILCPTDRVSRGNVSLGMSQPNGPHDHANAETKVQIMITTRIARPELRFAEVSESEDETLAASYERLKFENDDFICRGHILNAISDPLFDVYQNYSTAKELWNAIEECYVTEDATSKKFIISKFNSYKMVDSRPIMDQMYELEHILSIFTQNNMNMDESIQVASIIDKLPSTWKDVKKNLKHRKDVLSLKDLSKHLLIKEQYRLENKTNDDTSKRSRSKKINLSGWTLEPPDMCATTRPCGKFVGKGYHTGGMFKLNIKDVVNSSVNDVNITDISDANDASADEVLEKFRIYKSEVEIKCDTRIKYLQTDRGGEYYDPRYFQSMGIVHQVTAPYTPQHNGIAERKNRTLMDMVNSMMSYSGLSSGYWGEALLTAYARFDENRFKTIPKAHEISNEIVSIEIPITTKGNNDDSFSDHQKVKPRRSTRQRRQRTFSPDFEMYLVEGDRKGLIREYPIIYNLDEDPQTYFEAMKSHDSSFWKEAVNDEMDSIILERSCE